eukprot:3760651-Pyramimonas_sp.AAC.2
MVRPRMLSSKSTAIDPTAQPSQPEATDLSWGWFYAARGLTLDSPAALLLHVVRPTQAVMDGYRFVNNPGPHDPTVPCPTAADAVLQPTHRWRASDCQYSTPTVAPMPTTRRHHSARCRCANTRPLRRFSLVQVTAARLKP